MSFYSTRTVKAVRKARRCDECGTTIAVGQPATDYAQVFDGDLFSGSTHPDCEKFANKLLIADPYEGRPFLCEALPEEVDFNDGWLARNLPSDEMYDRLPKCWKLVVDEAREAARQGQLL